MIRCPTIDREMPVKRCLEYQQPGIGKDSMNMGEPTVYPCCARCRTGELLRLGQVDEAIQSAKREEQGMEITKKQCSRCKKVKPLEEFLRDKKAKDGHRNICLECNRAYQNDRSEGKGKKEEKASLPAREAEEHKMRHEAKLIDDHAKAARQRREEQAEPTPARECAAPTCPQIEDLILENQLLLDFSCYPEVLKEIKRIAHHAERPVEVQARFMLKVMLMDGWSEDTRAARGGCPVPLPHYEPMFFDANGVFPGDDRGGIPLVRDLEQRGGPAS